MTKIRVLIADDHPLIIEGLTTVLSRHDVEVVATATTAEEVPLRFAETSPEVLLLDVRFGGKISGLDIARNILAMSPQARVLFYSQFDQAELLREAYRIGAMGFVTKNTAPSVLADAIRQVHSGKTFFLPEIAERLALAGVRGDESPANKLDAREFEVFRKMAAGHTNAEIAEAMALSPKTISTTSQSIKDKLGVSRPADITLLAVKHQLINP
jgi:two-component system invasion response regulator UvrY